MGQKPGGWKDIAVRTIEIQVPAVSPSGESTVKLWPSPFIRVDISHRRNKMS